MFYQNEKLKTEVPGFDRLLYGGIQLHDMPSVTNMPPFPETLSIVIRSENSTDRTLLGMQLLHGLTKSMYALPPTDSKKEKEEINLTDPIFFTSNQSITKLPDIFLDIIISKCVQSIIKNNISKEDKWDKCQFSSTIFNVNFHEKIHDIDCSLMDKYIGEEIVVYNNRTNALHLTTSNRPNDNQYVSNDISNFIAKRKENDINHYPLQVCKNNMPSALADEFFKINICKTSSEYQKLCQNSIQNKQYVPCTVIMGGENDRLGHNSIVTIYLIDREDDIKKLNPDLLIELRTNENNSINYWINQLCIRKAVLQNTALGWHQYKRRDYGIEVYPSTHLLLQRRRHMPKTLLRSYYDILSDTFQQYLDSNPPSKSLGYADFIDYQKEEAAQRIQSIYDNLKNNLHTSKVLSNLIVYKWSDVYQNNRNEEIPKEEYKGQATVIIGHPNSYKRFLSLARTFSASSIQQHTLYVLLDQENESMRRRMVCPTWEFQATATGRGTKIFTERQTSQQQNEHPCTSCYKYIHFWNLRMGNITSDEFFYYFIQQIKIIKGLRQIVIDDIRKIEYSFPLLAQDKLFLTTLISICKDYETDLLILCDKSSPSVPELRSLADNVICTEREEDETHIYIEQYAGYNAASHIFACSIKKMEELFYCDCDSNYQGSPYHLNENRVDNLKIATLDKFWIDNNTKNIINTYQKRK